MKTTLLSLVLVLFVSACSLIADSSATASDTSLAKMATQLVAEKQTVRLGDPIIVSLSVSNQTQQVKEMNVDGNAWVFGNFEIIDPEGKTLPYVGVVAQTMVHGVAVQPGSTVTNVGTWNLTDEYLFQKAGRYSIRFSDGFNLSSSPAITVEVTAGRLSEMDEIVASLLPVCPKGWYLGKYPRMLSRPFGPGFGLQLYHNPMQREAVDLWFSKEEVKVDPNQQLRFEMVYLGHARGQLVYGSVGTNAPALWPTAIEDISRALQITKQ